MTVGIGYAFMVIVVAIVVDTVLGAVRAAKMDDDYFDIRVLPQFLMSGVLPYVGGLGILALAAQYVGEPFAALFYASAAAVTAKYVAEIKDKITALFGVKIFSDGGIGEGEK